MAKLLDMRSICPRVCCSSVMVVVFMILINFTVATHVSSLTTKNEDDVSVSLQEECSRRDPAMNPFYEVRYGLDMVWQIPADPKAVIFISTSRYAVPFSFFDPSPDCPQCYGLPEDRAEVLAALDRNYAILIVPSFGPEWERVNDWPPSLSQERSTVTTIIKEWTKEHELDHLPFASFGHSNGANFSTQLTLEFDVKALVLSCASGEWELLEHADPSVFPPTLYVDMPNDNASDGFYPQVVRALSILKVRGVKTVEFQEWPRPIFPSNFTEAIPCLGSANAEKIYAAYKAEGWIDDNGYVLVNPYYADSPGVLKKYDFLPYCPYEDDLCFSKHVEQELRMAYGFHSLSSEYNKEIFEWLDNTIFGDSSEQSPLWDSQ
ncbi:unnamed protein product [Calypogeia fissa]